MGDMFPNVRADLLRVIDPGALHADTRWSTRRAVMGLLDALGAWAVLEYRFRRWTRTLSLPARLLLRPVTMVTRKSAEIVAGVSISSDADLGPGLFIVHFGGIFVGPGVKAGSDLSLSQGVTLGVEKGGSPTIGDGVYFAPGAKAFGPIVMGHLSAAGANAVVTKDVADGTTVGGVPARPIGRRTPADVRAVQTI
jgi:serine O-acetyltransferase